MYGYLYCNYIVALFDSHVQTERIYQYSASEPDSGLEVLPLHQMSDRLSQIHLRCSPRLMFAAERSAMSFTIDAADA